MGINLEALSVYPACSLPGSPAVVTVTATDALDQKAPTANFGRTCVTLAAPGFEFVAAFPLENGAMSTSSPFISGITGTSAAVPLVSGAAALLKSVHPNWNASQIRSRLVSTAQPIDDLQRTAVRGGMGSGRLDLARALREPEPQARMPFTPKRPGFLMSILSSFLRL
jgi:subtilisin family serine protease